VINRDEIRAFIAIELPSDLKVLLMDFENRLKTPKSRCARWVDPKSIHLTLKFLGNVNMKLLDEIKRDVEVEVRKTRAFTLDVAGTGCFPNMLKPRVFWVGLRGETSILLDLQYRIDGATAKLGFAKESRPFTAHLTLARIKDDSSNLARSQFAETVKDATLGTDYRMDVNEVSLIRSQLRPEGAVYTRLCEFKMPG